MYKSKQEHVLEAEKIAAELCPDKEITGMEFLSIHPSGQENIAIYDPKDDTLTQENDINGEKREKSYTVHD